MKKASLIGNFAACALMFIVANALKSLGAFQFGNALMSVAVVYAILIFIIGFIMRDGRHNKKF